MKRLLWADRLRGIAILAILLGHCEVYYTGDYIIDYEYCTLNALCIFFFITGFFFYREDGFDFTHKMKSIGRTLIRPYIIFTLAMAVPKALANGTPLTAENLLLPIINGTVSWFLSALIVADILLSLLIRLLGEKNITICGIGLAALAASIIAQRIDRYDFWCYHEGLLAIFYLTCGYLFHRHMEKFRPLMRPSVMLCIFMIIVVVKLYVRHLGISQSFNNVENHPLFIIDTLSGILLMIYIVQLLPDIKFLEWTGRTSIVYYFLDGGVPLLVGRILPGIGFPYDGEYWRVVVAFLACYAVSTVIVWLVYRYIPYVTGRKAP